MKTQGRVIRSRMTKRLGAALSVALIGSTLAATGSQAAPKPEATAPKYGGTVTMLIDGSIAGHCFANALPAGPLGASRSIYESLVERTNKGK